MLKVSDDNPLAYISIKIWRRHLSLPVNFEQDPQFNSISVRKTKMDSLVNISLIVVKPCTEAYVKISSMEVFVEIVMG